MPYDGIFDGLVRASRYHSFTRELPDAWMFDVCGSGTTFRESFSAWKRESRSITIEDSILDEPLLLQWGMASDAFSIYLKLVEFSFKEILKKLFSSRACQYLVNDGTSRWESVAIDGTATGILNKLYRFE